MNILQQVQWLYKWINRMMIWFVFMFFSLFLLLIVGLCWGSNIIACHFPYKNLNRDWEISSVVIEVATHILLCWCKGAKRWFHFLTLFTFLPSRYAITIRWCALCTLLINSPVKRNYYTKWVVITPGWHHIPFPCPNIFLQGD